MPRRKAGRLVENEEWVAVAALRLTNMDPPAEPDGEVRFWVRDVKRAIEEMDPQLSVNDSTVNRALNHLAEMDWMWATWETENPANRLSSKPRLYFRLTETGRSAIVDLVADKRRSLPLWILDPPAVLGQAVDELELERRTRRSPAASRPKNARPAASKRPQGDAHTTAAQGPTRLHG